MTEPGPSEPSLAEALLRAEPAPIERRPASRWSYPQWGIFIASLFIAYHTAILLVWNLPSKGLNRAYHKSVMDKLKGSDYFNGTRNNQSWAMFAPNPNRSNTFIKVLVEDMDGQTYDFGQDIFGDTRYPYLWYDRRGKINRRIDGKKNYQRLYGAWVCREWERTHGGEPAKSVTFVKWYTKVPPHKLVIEQGGWDPWDPKHVKKKEQDTITCKTTMDAQLPNDLRERYGFPPIDESLIRRTDNRTWVQQREAEQRKAERDAKMIERGLKAPGAEDGVEKQGGNVEEQDEY